MCARRWSDLASPIVQVGPFARKAKVAAGQPVPPFSNANDDRPWSVSGPSEGDPEEVRDDRSLEYRVQVGNLLLAQRRTVRPEILRLVVCRGRKDDSRVQAPVEL